MPLRKSLIQTEQVCRCPYCGRTQDLRTHEVFYGTANRKKSIEDGMTIYVCDEHHNMSSSGIHFDKYWDLWEKKNAQVIWMQHYGTEEDFIKRYGKSYLRKEDYESEDI